jgi:hypothetical protein
MDLFGNPNESSQSSMRQNESKVVLLKDEEWSAIDGDVCKVTAFNPLGSFKDDSGAVRSMDISTPYAAVTIENKKLGTM